MGLHRENSFRVQQEIASPQCLIDCRSIVLASRADEYALLSECLKQLLIDAVQLAAAVPAHAIRADLPEDSAPQRAVQIGDQALLRRPRLDQAGQRLAQGIRVPKRVGKAGEEIGSQIPS